MTAPTRLAAADAEPASERQAAIIGDGGMDIPASLDEQIRCVKREIAMRKSAYPRFVAAGRMKLDAAEREIATMATVLATLEGLRELEAGGRR